MSDSDNAFFGLKVPEGTDRSAQNTCEARGARA